MTNAGYGGGTTSPLGVQYVPSGGSLTFTVIPNDESYLDDVRVNNVSVYDDLVELPDVYGYRYTLTNITAHQTVRVTYQPY